ncbi:MAG: GTPase ObgE [Planctomycetes bacterium]|nr:GTPase ObgE [Planctomycetota bacterium]
MFVDEIEIQVRGGDGGAGCLSFRREKYVPRGGPNGGNGGDGGSVILTATQGISSLHHLKGHAEFAARNGRGGAPKTMTGADGEDRELQVPVGTVVLDPDHGNVLADLDHDGAFVVAARGGRRGRGNQAFATSINRTPRQVEPGLPGEERRVKLVLKLIADVGLVGLPNAGKSTLLSVLSKARPKIAAYPFTTLTPALGIVEVSTERTMVMADIPGLIEGAHGGRGLGDQFLRHIERTRLLLQLVDCSEFAMSEPEEAVRVIRRELTAYSGVLADRPWVLCATKVESEAAEELAATLEAAVGRPVLRISAVAQKGLDGLVGALLRELDASRA